MVLPVRVGFVLVTLDLAILLLAACFSVVVVLRLWAWRAQKAYARDPWELDDFHDMSVGEEHLGSEATRG